jgi:hypothetical protein
MTKVDFFREEETIHSSHFGICDNEDEKVKTPAFVDCDIKNEASWTANVLNHTGDHISFIAVDNKIEILREDGSMENRCDAMLHNVENIIFVELKIQRLNWIKHAVEEQLQTTIQIFKENNDIKKFRHRLAYVCNRKHPRFCYSNKQLMQQFRDRNDVRLIISRDIVIKK